MDAEKINKLVSLMTLEEKAALTTGDNAWETVAYERLGIPSIWMTDGPHGLRREITEINADGTEAVKSTVPSVSFPSECASAASFDRENLEKIGKELGTECQANHVQVLLGPGVNMKRSPLCGRNFEYLSEDPYLAGELGTAYVDGLQSEGVGACVKHFCANSQETERMTGSSQIDERALREIYLSAFERVVKKAHPWSIMASYNKLNGVQMTENRKVLTDILRVEWGFDGAVISDWGATHNRPKAVAGGCDLTMPANKEDTMSLVQAVKSGMFPESLLDTACRNILTLVYRGYENIRDGVDPAWEHGHEVVRKAEEGSAVLLRNEGNVLPLDKKSNVAFIGEFAKKPRFQGGGSSHVNTHAAPTNAYDEAVSKGYHVTWSQGYNTSRAGLQNIGDLAGSADPVSVAAGTDFTADPELIAEAVEAAGKADAAVVFAGLTDVAESEGYDRGNMRLPADQIELIEAVAEVQPNTIVVLHNGSPVEMPWRDKVSGILEMYLGGEAVGEATVNLLFGDVNPSGRLPETFPLRLEDTPCYLFYPGKGGRAEYPEGIFIGYRYYESKKMPVLYPFGYGLSYTSFSYSGLKIDRDVFHAGDKVHVNVDVENTGRVPGREVIQLYVGIDHSDIVRPVKELRGFDKISLDPGEKKAVSFTLDDRSFSYWDIDDHAFRIAGGDFRIIIGSNAHDEILTMPIKVIDQGKTHHDPFSDISLVEEMFRNPAGFRFLSEHGRDIIRGINASGISATMGQEIDPDALRDEQILGMFSSGMGTQPIQVLKMFLPDMQVNDWNKLYAEMDKAW